MNARELADALGVHEATIRRKIHSGEIEAIKTGRSYRIPEDEVGRLLAETNEEDLKTAKKMAIQEIIRDIGLEIEEYLDMIHAINTTVNTPDFVGDRHNYVLKMVEHAEEVAELEKLKIRLENKRDDEDI